MVSDIINTLICTLKKGLMQPAVSVKTDVPTCDITWSSKLQQKITKNPKKKKQMNQLSFLLNTIF